MHYSANFPETLIHGWAGNNLLSITSLYYSTTSSCALSNGTGYKCNANFNAKPKQHHISNSGETGSKPRNKSLDILLHRVAEPLVESRVGMHLMRSHPVWDMKPVSQLQKILISISGHRFVPAHKFVPVDQTKQNWYQLSAYNLCITKTGPKQMLYLPKHTIIAINSNTYPSLHKRSGISVIKLKKNKSLTQRVPKTAFAPQWFLFQKWAYCPRIFSLFNNENK